MGDVYWNEYFRLLHKFAHYMLKWLIIGGLRYWIFVLTHS
jgi:hypothetical protein